MTQEELTTRLAEIIAPIVEQIIEVAPDICKALRGAPPNNAKDTLRH